MPTPVVESDAWTTTINVPNDTEGANQASLLSNFVQGLANRTTHLRKGIPGIASSYQLEVPLAAIQSASDRFTGNASGWLQTDVASGGPLYIVLPRVPYGKIDELHVLVSAFGHAALPANKPQVGLFRWNATPGDPAVGSSYAAPVGGAYTVDPSAAVADYDKVHLISATGMNYTPDPYELIQLVIWGESGANAVADRFKVARAWLVIKP